ncbi:hypothetical protein ACL1CK_14250, partial [Corynebacterium striatum]
GFVMFAGGGANLAQQFPSLATWVGALIMLVLVLITGLLDVDKATAVLGLITPFIIVFIGFVTIYSLVTNQTTLEEANNYAIHNVD